MRQSRRHFSVSQKAQIVRRHLSGKEPVSKLADEFGVQPSQIHTWVKQVLDQAERALDRPAGRPPRSRAGCRRSSSSNSKPSSSRRTRSSPS